MKIRNVAVLMLCLALILAICGCTSETPQNKPATTIAKAATSRPPAPVTTKPPATIQNAPETTSTTTTTTTTTTSTTTPTTASTSTTAHTTASTTSSTFPSAATSVPTSTTFPVPPASTTNAFRPDLILTLSTDKYIYDIEDDMEITVSVDSLSPVKDAVINVFGISQGPKYAIDLSRSYTMDAGIENVSFNYKVPNCNETACIPPGSYKIYADLSKGGRPLARAEAAVSITGNKTSPAERKVALSILTDKDVYNGGDAVVIVLEAVSATEVSGALVKVSGPKSASSRFADERRMDLLSGMNNMTFSYQMPACTSCSGLAAGSYPVNADIFLNGRILARASKDVFVNA